MRVPRILLVDDDTAVAHVLTTWLRRTGYDVVSASSGHEAEALLEERYDALVLDLRLPGMRGDAFYYLASARQPWLATHTLFLTGDISAQAEEIIAVTGCPYLQKPFSLHELAARVGTMAPLPAQQMPRVG
jgi:DNA-binding response OmpR family regulator